MGRSKKTVAATHQVRIAQNALKNIDEITGSIAFIRQQPLNAMRVGDKIFETIERIEINPFAFQECKELPTKARLYRRAVCLSWQIIYKISSPEIVILGIIHNSRKPSVVRSLRKDD